MRAERGTRGERIIAEVRMRSGAAEHMRGDVRRVEQYCRGEDALTSHEDRQAPCRRAIASTRQRSRGFLRRQHRWGLRAEARARARQRWKRSRRGMRKNPLICLEEKRGFVANEMSLYRLDADIDCRVLLSLLYIGR